MMRGCPGVTPARAFTLAAAAVELLLVLLFAAREACLCNPTEAAADIEAPPVDDDEGTPGPIIPATSRRTPPVPAMRRDERGDSRPGLAMPFIAPPAEDAEEADDDDLEPVVPADGMADLMAGIEGPTTSASFTAKFSARIITKRCE
jgi:hypothetical protein